MGRDITCADWQQTCAGNCKGPWFYLPTLKMYQLVIVICTQMLKHITLEVLEVFFKYVLCMDIIIFNNCNYLGQTYEYLNCPKIKAKI